MDQQTSKIVEIYNCYLLPSKRNYNNYFETFVLPTILELRKSYRISQLLNYGYGIGHISIDIARHLPNAEVRLIDLVDASLHNWGDLA